MNLYRFLFAIQTGVLLSSMICLFPVPELFFTPDEVEHAVAVAVVSDVAVDVSGGFAGMVVIVSTLSDTADIDVDACSHDGPLPSPVKFPSGLEMSGAVTRKEGLDCVARLT
jgi:hypothetical protein